MKLSSCIVTSLFLVGLTLQAAEPERQSGNPPRRAPYPERLHWWAEGRFGMFIHWGPVSLKGTEISWSRANTNPKCPNQRRDPGRRLRQPLQGFQPDAISTPRNGWASPRPAGTKYMVLTAKHCDGFLLWHSKASDYNICATPFQRTSARNWRRRRGRRACGSAGTSRRWTGAIRTSAPNATRRSSAGCRRKLRELLSNYGAIDLLWFDWDGREPLYDQAATYPHREDAAAADRHQQPARPGHRQQRPPDPVAQRRLLHARAACRRL